MGDMCAVARSHTRPPGWILPEKRTQNKLVHVLEQTDSMLLVVSKGAPGHGFTGGLLMGRYAGVETRLHRLISAMRRLWPLVRMCRQRILCSRWVARMRHEHSTLYELLEAVALSFSCGCMEQHEKQGHEQGGRMEGEEARRDRKWKAEGIANRRRLSASPFRCSGTSPVREPQALRRQLPCRGSTEKLSIDT